MKVFTLYIKKLRDLCVLAVKTPFFPAVLLGVLFAQVVSGIPQLSVTFDEPVHITTGYSILRTGDYRLVEDHPPLLEMWMSWPHLLSPDIPQPEEIPTWAQGDRRLFAHHEIWWQLPIDTWLVPARMCIAFLAIILGAWIYRWAADWFGTRAGLLALALLAFDPNILAHAQLATLDLGVTCLIFATMYGFQRILSRPSYRTIAATGILLGLALSAKSSAFILLPITVGLMLLWKFTPLGPPAGGGNHAFPLALYLGTAFLTLWAVHGFQIGKLAGFPIPLPAPTYVRALLRVGGHVASDQRIAFLMGESYYGGRWDYFPIAFALKTPLPTLLLLVAALLSTLYAITITPKTRSHNLTLSSPHPVSPSPHLPLWRVLLLGSVPLAYALISIVSALNIGYRHLLPILPFAYVFIARLAATNPARTRPHKPFRQHLVRIGFALLVLWQAVGTLRVWPFHLTYFNELAGGPKQGYRYLADSNVDWGQGLKALRAYLASTSTAENQSKVASESKPYLSSFVYFVPPDLVYGIQAEPLPPLPEAPAVLPAPYNPAPGTYIISASTLRGLQLAEPEMYHWFWQREPDAMIANAMLVYHVQKPASPARWIAQCTQPVVPLPAEVARTQFGLTERSPGLRQLSFDCSQSWLYPQAGTSRGWFVLHRDLAQRSNGTPTKGTFIERHLAPARLSFDKRLPSLTPPHTVFAWTPGTTLPLPAKSTAWIAPVTWPIAQALEQGTAVEIPSSTVAMDGPLAFLGYTVQREEAALHLVTYWQVTQKPERPFSLMAHLVNMNSQPVAVGDGLGIPWEQMQAGDMIVQRHGLDMGEQADGEYWLQTGGYWLDTLERFPVLVEGAPVGDRIIFPSFR